MATKQAEKYVAREKDGPLIAKKFHLFTDCSKLRDTPGIVMHPVTDEHVELLGLRACTACEKRETGGPAIEALEGFFGEDWPYNTSGEAVAGEPSDPRDAAWQLVEYLNERNVYLAVRKPKDNGSPE